jgi:2-hydroxy-6-oxonona-2,4-dienedioate hydrolase
MSESARAELEAVGLMPPRFRQPGMGDPERVDRLVLNTMAGLPVDAEDGWTAFAALVERSGQAMASLDAQLIRRRLEWVVADAATVTDELVALRRRIWEDDGWQRIARRVITLLTPERYVPQQIGVEELSRIKAPALVVWTRANPVHGLEAAQQAVAALPRGELAVIEDAAHWPQVEQPEAFNAAVLAFLRAGVPEASSALS